jgi:hypothetical protein
MGLRGTQATVPWRSSQPDRRPSGRLGGRYRQKWKEARAAVAVPASHRQGFWELLWGQNEPARSAFRSRAEMKQAWEECRAEMMLPSCFGMGAGKRPWAYWFFDRPREMKDASTESEAVWLMGGRDQAEVDAIEAGWLQAVRDSLAQHPHDRNAAERVAFERGCPRWAHRAFVDEGLAQPPSSVAPIKRKRGRRTIPEAPPIEQRGPNPST